MKTLNLLRILSVLLLVFVTLAAASRAYADTHTQDVITVDDTFTLPANTIDNPCTFDILVHDYGVLRANHWYDENNQITGNIYIFGHVREDLSANGKTINIQLQGPILTSVEYFSSYIEVYAKTSGANIIATVPHEGKIWGGGGQILETFTYDYDWNLISYSLDREVGNISWDRSTLCEYLGSE